jgi:uncharacterized protein YodC (DUF2158 family)
MTQIFKRGDVVRLKSGGPNMTIDNYERGHDIIGAINGNAAPSWDTEYVNCSWFDKTTRKVGRFHQDLLEKISQLV